MELDIGQLSESRETTLRHNVVRTLQQKGYPQHRALVITVRHSTVMVEGHVPTWHLRQIALECIKHVAGVAAVIDQIQVVTESPGNNTEHRSMDTVQQTKKSRRPESKTDGAAGIPVISNGASLACQSRMTRRAL